MVLTSTIDVPAKDRINIYPRAFQPLAFPSKLSLKTTRIGALCHKGLRVSGTDPAYFWYRFYFSSSLLHQMDNYE